MDEQEAGPGEAAEEPSGPEVAGLFEQVRPAVVGVVALTVLTGIVYPLILALPAWVLFPGKAGGSLVVRDGVVVGSRLVGQEFSGPGYFSGRPSAAGAGYDAASSGGTNLGPDNPKLVDGAEDDPATPGDESFVGARRLAAEYRARNGLPARALIPIDAVTRSGSGLDPQISPANAEWQVARVARERGFDPGEVRRLVAEHTRGRSLGFLGEPGVDVLPLNLALDRIAPGRVGVGLGGSP
jgi:K+-transporting ATPase ATPase C chain